MSQRSDTSSGNAAVFSFVTDLHLKGNDINNVATLFYVTYIVFDNPWVVAVKRFGANKVLAIAMVGWSITTLSTGFMQNYGQALTLRLLLGLFEAGLLPPFTFFISTIWNRESQAKRVAVLYCAAAVSGPFGGLIAYGIQSMGMRAGLAPLAPWRWLFIIKGIVSVVVCSLLWLSLPQSAEQAWFLKEDEKALMRIRKDRYIICKGDDKFDWSYAMMAIKDPHIGLATLCLAASGIPLLGFGTFLPTIINGLGYTSLQANYLTIPVYTVCFISVTAVSIVSDRFNKRGVFLLILPIPIIVGYIIMLATPNTGAGYFAMFLCGGGLYAFDGLILAWIATNLSPDYKRTVGPGIFASLGSVSSLISSQIYEAKTAPRYITGNDVSLSTEVLALAMIGVIMLLLRRRNMVKERLTRKGVTDNDKLGDRALGFKYTI